MGRKCPTVEAAKSLDESGQKEKKKTSKELLNAGHHETLNKATEANIQHFALFLSLVFQTSRCGDRDGSCSRS